MYTVADHIKFLEKQASIIEAAKLRLEGRVLCSFDKEKVSSVFNKAAIDIDAYIQEMNKIADKNVDLSKVPASVAQLLQPLARKARLSYEKYCDINSEVDVYFDCMDDRLSKAQNPSLLIKK